MEKMNSDKKSTTNTASLSSINVQNLNIQATFKGPQSAKKGSRSLSKLT